MRPNAAASIETVGSDMVRIGAGASNPAVSDDELTISEMAARFAVTPRALRFYESKGLLAPARVGRGRIYRRADQQHLALILKGRRLGFTIAEIGQMIAVEEGQACPQSLRMTRDKCQEQIAHLERQLAETTEALAELRRIHAALSRA